MTLINRYEERVDVIVTPVIGRLVCSRCTESSVLLLTLLPSCVSFLCSQRRGLKSEGHARREKRRVLTFFAM